MPSLRNILVEPETQVRWTDTPKGAPTVAEVRVSGLVCDSLCVRRVQGALERLPRVTEVRFQEADDAFLVSFQGRAAADAQLEAAVHGQVVLPRLRRWLGKIRQALFAQERPRPPD